MNRFATLLVTATLSCLSARSDLAFSEINEAPLNAKIMIDYQEPLNPQLFEQLDPNDTSLVVKEKFIEYEKLKGVYERLRERKVLERYAQFLVPFRLPMTLRLIGRQCNEANALFRPSDTSITLCYEYVSSFEERAPDAVTEDGITRDDAIIGGIISALLHETGHALFYMYQVPVLGREEDAADQFAAYLMLQFGDDISLMAIKGALWKWMNRSGSLSDVHSTPQQRVTTFLCIAYGKKPALFQSFVDNGHLSTIRAANCKREYEQIERAFVKTIQSYIDPDLMTKVLATVWLSSEDLGIAPMPTR